MVRGDFRPMHHLSKAHEAFRYEYLLRVLLATPGVLSLANRSIGDPDFDVISALLSLSIG